MKGNNKVAVSFPTIFEATQGNKRAKKIMKRFTTFSGFELPDDLCESDRAPAIKPKPSAADIGYGLRQIELRMDEFRTGKKPTKRQEAVNTKAETISDEEYEWFTANGQSRTQNYR